MRLESELKPGELWDVACGLLTDEGRRARMARAALERGAPDAAERIAFELLDLAAAESSSPAATDSTGRSAAEGER
jgi:UDP-N-acetylglucosamine:LPS N-acetylglucosamine transferase